MVEAVGSDVVERALSKLPPRVRAQYDAITPEAWVPLDLSAQIIQAVAREAGREPDEFFAEVVRAGTLRALDAFYKTLLRFAWDEMLVARAAASYRRIRNIGRLEATLLRPGHAIAQLREWPRLTEHHARSLGYTMEAFFLAAGRQDVVVAHTLEISGPPAVEPDGATYRCSWRS